MLQSEILFYATLDKYKVFIDMKELERERKHLMVIVMVLIYHFTTVLAVFNTDNENEVLACN